MIHLQSWHSDLSKGLIEFGGKIDLWTGVELSVSFVLNWMSKISEVCEVWWWTIIRSSTMLIAKRPVKLSNKIFVFWKGPSLIREKIINNKNYKLDKCTFVKCISQYEHNHLLSLDNVSTLKSMFFHT